MFTRLLGLPVRLLENVCLLENVFVVCMLIQCPGDQLPTDRMLFMLFILKRLSD